MEAHALKCFARAMLVSTLCLLSFVTSASAECAWVLWVEDQRFGNPQGRSYTMETTTWTVLGASSKETECRRTLRETIERVTHPEVVSDDLL